MAVDVVVEVEVVVVGGPWGKGGVPGGKGCKYLLWRCRKVAMPVETKIDTLGKNGVQGSRAHRSACLVQVQAN